MPNLSEEYYNVSGNDVMYAFAIYPSIKIYQSSSGSTMANHLLFGDYIKILETNIENGRVRARSRNTNGWVEIDELQKERVLEVNFIDIGQGDGCHIVTPDDKHILVDAGQEDNMNRYLQWRFNLYNKTHKLASPFTVVISHSDTDHYKGFNHIFSNDKIWVDKIYHNGIVERPGPDPLGTVENGHITGLVQTTSEMKDLLQTTASTGTGSTYCNTLRKVLKYSPDVEFISLSNRNEYIDGYAAGNTVNDKQLLIKTLGPILKETNGKDSLQVKGDGGIIKNGNSVLLKVIYDKVRILMGGDINEEFGKILCDFYEQKDDIKAFEVDLAKACHHGSHKFHYEFIRNINAAATVISSGDNESHAHPRPDAIGALGKCGYGDRPLIFSTELARSNQEFTMAKFEKIAKLLSSLKNSSALLEQLTGIDERKALELKIIKTNKDINSFLTRYGMVNVRTDGKKMIVAQKLETDAAKSKWNYYKLEYSKASKRFELV